MTSAGAQPTGLVLLSLGITVDARAIAKMEKKRIQADSELDGAVLDINLRDEAAYKVADALSARAIPFLLATGYGENLIPARYRALPRCQKPFEPLDIVNAWAALRADRKGPGKKQLVGNEILAALNEQTIDRLSPYLEIMELPKRTILDVGSCYFLRSGIASCTITNQARSSVEVGLVGREGVTGLQVVSHRRSSRLRSSMLVAGAGARIDNDALMFLYKTESNLRGLLQSFSETFVDQMAANLLASTRYSVQQRLARWLLLVNDRSGCGQIAVSHEEIAFGLGVRRAGVTFAISELTKLGCLDHGRGQIEIVDRKMLVAASIGCYP
jgi:CRP-like cAMP-binding protein